MAGRTVDRDAQGPPWASPRPGRPDIQVSLNNEALAASTPPSPLAWIPDNPRPEGDRARLDAILPANEVRRSLKLDNQGVLCHRWVLLSRAFPGAARARDWHEATPCYAEFRLTKKRMSKRPHPRRETHPSTAAQLTAGSRTPTPENSACRIRRRSAPGPQGCRSRPARPAPRFSPSRSSHRACRARPTG